MKQFRSFAFRYFPFMALLTLLLTAAGCRSGTPYRTLESPLPEKALIYLLRPAISVWSWRDFTVTVYAYQGHFSDSEMELIESFEMSNNEFRRLYLEPGYYRLELNGYSSRIIRARPGALEFFEVHLFSEGYFHFPDLDIKEITGKRALMEMAGSHPMYEFKNPLYCCSNGSGSPAP